MLFNHALLSLANHGPALSVSSATSPDAAAANGSHAVILMFVVIAAVFVLGRSFSMLRDVAAQVVPLIQMFAQVAKVAIMMIGVVLLLLLAVFATYVQH